MIHPSRDALMSNEDAHEADAADLPIDFRRSLPPYIPELDSYLSAALDELSGRPNLGLLLRQSTARGSEEDRAAGAELLGSRFGPPPDSSRIIITNGTQNALLILLRMLVGTKGLLLAERLSYGALTALARLADVQLQGIDIDADGIVPDAFEAACRNSRPGALYCNPTVHNPTTSVMPEDRRRAIADIARKYGVAIIEDDALGRLHPDSPPPIAALAPDITWYVMTMTKCLSQGLRIAYLLTPDAPLAQRSLVPVEHLSCWHASPLSVAIVSQWMKNGAAAHISARITEECIARERLATQILANQEVRSASGSMHIWIDLPATLRRGDLLAAAEKQGVLLRPSELFAVDEQPVPNALRLSLSPPASRAAVARGLHTLQELIEAAL
ncbi:MAG: PLP-dependent aminotransferase family protein [Steroidobacteraceae bacterium]